MTTDGREDVLGVGTSGREIVDVGIEYQVVRRVEKRCPVAGSFETVLDLDGDTLVHLLSLCNDAVQVCDDPVGRVLG